LITAFGGEKMAGEAFRLGAARYREKPFPLRAPVEAVKTAARGEEREAPA
jgi:DNA-binding NtrC family response regulator